MNKASSFPRRRESTEARRLGPRFPFGMRSAIRGGDMNEDLSFPRRRESREARRLGPRFPFGMRSAIRGGDTGLSRDFLA